MNGTRAALVIALLLGTGVHGVWGQEGKKAAGPAAVRTALVARQAGPAALGVLDLAYAGLAEERRVELLERQAVERILREQKLSLAGLVDAASAVRAGQVLNADLLGVLETADGGKEAIGLVVYDAGTGVKYVDQSLPAGGAADQGASVADAVKAAVRKRDLGPGGLKLLGVLAVRNADLPRERDALCRSLARVLERELAHSPGVAVLERKRLALLNEERALAPGAAAQKLLASVYTLELEFSRSVVAAGGMKAAALLSDGAGKRLATLRADAKEPGGADLPAALAEAVRKHFRVGKPPKAVERKAESRRFQLEAGLLWSFRQPHEAFEAVEAALALAPDNYPARQNRIEYLSMHAADVLQQAVLAAKGSAKLKAVKPEAAREALDAHRRSIDHHLDLLTEMEGRSPQAAHMVAVAPLFMRTRHGMNTTMFRVLDGARQPAAWREARDEADEACFRLALRQAAVLGDLARREPPFFRGYANFATHYFSLAPGRGHAAKTPAYLRFSTTLAKQWAEVTRHPAVLKHLLTPERLKDYDQWNPRMPDLTPEGIEAFTGHPHPWLALDAKVYLARSKYDRPGVGFEEKLKGFQEARKAYAEAIEATKAVEDRARRDALRERVYLAWKRGLHDWHLGNENFIREMVFLLDYMLDRGDVVYEIVSWLRPQGTVEPEPAERWRLLKKAVAVIDASGRRGEPLMHGLRRNLLVARDHVLKTHPAFAKSDPKFAAEDPYAGVVLPWTARVLALRKDVPKAHALRLPFVEGGHLYFLAVTADGVPRTGLKNPAVQLVRVPLEGGKPEPLSRCPATLGTGMYPHHEVIASACLAVDTVYVGTQRDGILALPLGKGPGKKLDLDLPSRHVAAIAYLRGKLYAHLEGGYLVAVNTESGSFTTLASSRRRERLSPFDDGEPFEVPFMAADPGRDRVLLLARELPRKPTPQGRPSVHGLWAYDVKGDRFVRLLEGIRSDGAYSEAHLLRHGTVQRDGKLLLSGIQAAVEFDPAADKARLLRCGPVSPVPALPPEKALVREAKSTFGIALVLRDGWLWTFGGSTVRRLSLAGRHEEFPFLGRGVPVLWGQGPAYMMEVGADGLLAGDNEGFVLLTFTRPPAGGGAGAAGAKE